MSNRTAVAVHWVEQGRAAIAALGIAFESIGDFQMTRFRAATTEPRRGHGPRPLALHAPPELLWRGVRVGGGSR